MTNATHDGSVLILNAPASDFRDAVVLGQGLPSEKDGMKVAYRWKESLPLGRYIDAKGKPFEVTPARIETLVLNFNKAKSKGFLPRISNGHTTDATKTMGYLVDARKNAKGNLELLHQLIGDDAIAASSRNKTSICTVGNVTDETGETYDELIDHQALVPDPRLNNLEDFQAVLAASRAAVAKAVILNLAAKENPQMDLTQLREVIGADKEVSDEKLIELAIGKLTENKASLALSNSATAEVTQLKEKLATTEAQVLQLSRTPDLDLLSEVADVKAQRIELCLERGQCTKAQADELKKMLKDGDKPSVLMLSKSGTAGTAIDGFLKILELNKPFIGTLTGMQRVADPNKNPEVTPERLAELKSYAGL